MSEQYVGKPIRGTRALRGLRAPPRRTLRRGAGGNAQGPRIRDARRTRRRRRAGQRAQPRQARPPAGRRRSSEVLDELRRLAAGNTIAEPMIGLGYSGTITPGVIRRNVLGEPGLVHGVHPVPARDQPGTPRGAAQLPDDGDRPHRARHGQRLAARREHRGGRGRHAHAPPGRQRGRTGSSSMPTACRRRSPCWRPASRPSGSSRRGRPRVPVPVGRLLRHGAAVSRAARAPCVTSRR